MTKGKPWPIEDEKKLRDWFHLGTTDLSALVFAFEGEYTKEGIRQKLISIGLLKEQQLEKKNARCCSSKLELPPELPSIEDTLKTLSAALELLKTPGLDKAEVLRLRGIISGCKVYKELLVDYADYRGLEIDLAELREKYAELAKKSSNNAS